MPQILPLSEKLALAFKALVYDPVHEVFKSPSRSYFLAWPRDGIVTSECPYIKQGSRFYTNSDGIRIIETCAGEDGRERAAKLHDFECCSCGIWSTFDSKYAWEYRFNGKYHKEVSLLMSTLVLVQPLGDTVIAWEKQALTIRSEKAVVVGVVAEPNQYGFVERAATRAGQYFDVPTVTLEEAQRAVDIQNLYACQLPEYGGEWQYELLYISIPEYKKFVMSIRVPENEIWMKPPTHT